MSSKQLICLANNKNINYEEVTPTTTLPTSPGDSKYRIKDGIMTYSIKNMTGDLPDTHLGSIVLNMNITQWMLHVKNLKAKRVFGNTVSDYLMLFNGSDPYFNAGGQHDDGYLAYTWLPSPQPSFQFETVFNDSPTLRWSVTGADILAHIADPVHYPDPRDPTTFGTIALSNTGLHEFGHQIGLGHSKDPNDIMYPYYNGKYKLSANDISRAQLLYGVSGIQTHVIESFDAILDRIHAKGTYF